MNSKEALKRIYYDAISGNEIEEDVEEIKNDYDLIKQDLDRLEQLEKENQELKEKLDGIPLEYDGYLYFTKSISNVVKENTKLKKPETHEESYTEIIEPNNNTKDAKVINQRVINLNGVNYFEHVENLTLKEDD